MSEKIEQHDLLVLVKDLAIELGYSPTRYEFLKKTELTEWAIKTAYGSYTDLLLAAGLTPYREKKITNKIFDVNIEKHLENYEPKVISVSSDPIPTIASISDIHWPFVCQRVVNKFYEYIGDVKPDVVIINGDAWDMYSHSKFPRSHNQFTPKEEEQKAREQNEIFWTEIQKRSPQSKCYQLLGNHDIRPMKRVLESYPEAEDWIKERLERMFSFCGVKTIHDPREELIFGNVAIHHGYRSKLGDHRDYMLMNSINGHTHMGGVVYRKIRGNTLWELNSGYAGDPESKGLTYTPQKITNSTPGFGAVDKLGPRFIIC